MVVKDSVTDLSALLDSISWGHRIVEVADQTFVFRPLTLAERNTSIFVYDQAFNQALRDGTPTQDDLMVTANQAGLWHPDRDEHLVMMRQELATREEELAEFRKSREQKDGKRRIQVRESKRRKKDKLLEKRVHQIQSTLHELYVTRANLIEFPSAEHHADHARAVHMIQCATLTFPDLIQKWATLQAIRDTTETDLVFSLISAFNSQHAPNITDVRALARSGLWRIRWSVAKSTGSFDQLFDVSLSDLIAEQMLLIHWSQVYDSAYDAYERPPDYIIEDDAEFDKWLEKTIKEQEQERRKQFQAKKSNLGLGKASTSNANEVMVPTDGFYSDECTCGAVNKKGHAHASNCPYGVFLYYRGDRKYQEIDRVHESNPDAVRVVLVSETKALEGKGAVREEHLRRYKSMARQVMGFNTNIHGVENRKKR